MLKNTTQKRKAQIHRDIGIIAMTKDFDGAFEKALEYLTKSWKVWMSYRVSKQVFDGIFFGNLEMVTNGENSS